MSAVSQLICDIKNQPIAKKVYKSRSGDALENNFVLYIKF